MDNDDSEWVEIVEDEDEEEDLFDYAWVDDFDGGDGIDCEKCDDYMNYISDGLWICNNPECRWSYDEDEDDD